MLFRYPGGKAKLADKICQLLDFTGGVYAEPFLGGGSVAISIVKYLEHARLISTPAMFLLNDLDPHMWAFWYVAICGTPAHFNELVERMKATPTIGMFNSMRDGTPTKLVDKAYHAIFFNRTTFSGILTSGPIGGYKQESDWKIDVRWNSDRLIAELKECRELLLGRTEVHNKDFRCFLEYSYTHSGVKVYADPPYYVQGNALYAICKDENKWTHETHEALRDILKEHKDWVLSYDNCKEVKKLYKGFKIDDKVAAYYSITDKKKRPNGEGKELLITP